jgi:ribosomal protein L12E/L44/L45/RPP1/RPP2
MKEMAVYLMLVLGGNSTPSADDVTAAMSAVGLEADSEQLSKLIGDLDGKDLNEVITEGKEMLAKFGGGGGGGGGGSGGGDAGGAAEAAVEEKEVEEEEAAPAGGGLFGDDGGKGGDY